MREELEWLATLQELHEVGCRRARGLFLSHQKHFVWRRGQLLKILKQGNDKAKNFISKKSLWSTVKSGLDGS